VAEYHALPVKLSFGPSYMLLPSLLAPKFAPLANNKTTANSMFGSKTQQSYSSKENKHTLLLKTKVRLYAVRQGAGLLYFRLLNQKAS